MWQLIDTVPKERDRTVLLFVKEDQGPRGLMRDCVCSAYWSESRDKWVAEGTEESLFYGKPTHWMDPPPPPDTDRR